MVQLCEKAQHSNPNRDFPNSIYKIKRTVAHYNPNPTVRPSLLLRPAVNCFSRSCCSSCCLSCANTPDPPSPTLIPSSVLPSPFTPYSGGDVQDTQALKLCQHFVIGKFQQTEKIGEITKIPVSLFSFYQNTPTLKIYIIQKLRDTLAEDTGILVFYPK